MIAPRLRGRGGAWPAIAVGVVTVAIRVGSVVASSGGFTGNRGYDAGVYYAAGDALVHGRTPYHDFVLLHPPLIMVVLAPFAWLGSLTSDLFGFVTASCFFLALSALTAALIVRVGEQLGLGRWPSVLGGLFYAVWFVTVTSDSAPRLESVGSFLLVLAVHLLLRGPTRRQAVAAGACVGAALLLKIWWIVPLVVITAWLARDCQRRQALPPFLLGALAAAVAIGAPFFLRAPGGMWRMVVTDQLGRPRQHGLARRIVAIAGLGLREIALDEGLLVRLYLPVAILAAVVVAAAWRQRRARLFVVLGGAQAVVLVAAPVLLTYYPAYWAVPAAVVVAAAAAEAGRAGVVGRVSGGAAVGLVAGVAVGTAVSLHDAPGYVSSRFPRHAVAAAAHPYRCIVSDSPMSLIAIGALSRGLDDSRCPNWVDVTGQAYTVRHSDGVSLPHNRTWQRAVTAYLYSGDAYLLVPRGSELSRRTTAVLRANPVLAGDRDGALYRRR